MIEGYEVQYVVTPFDGPLASGGSYIKVELIQGNSVFPLPLLRPL